MTELMQGLKLVKFSKDYQEAFCYGEIDKPQIKSPYDVLVRIKVAGVNPVEGKMALPSRLANLLVSVPSIIGADFSGIVEGIGSKVTDLKVGDPVYGALQMPVGLQGSFAQYAIVNSSKASIAKKPDHLSFEEAATAGIAFLTAYTGIVHPSSKKDSSSKTVLIIGASGGVGGFAVQIAKAIGYTKVIGICSSKNTDYVKSLGADQIINYDKETDYQAFIQNKDNKESIDLILDGVGGEDYYNQLEPLLKKDGLYSTAVGPVQHFGSEPVTVSAILNVAVKVIYKKLFGSRKYRLIGLLPHHLFKSEIAPLFQSEAITKSVSEDNIIPLSEGQKAFEKLRSHRTVGKIVLRVD